MTMNRKSQIAVTKAQKKKTNPGGNGIQAPIHGIRSDLPMLVSLEAKRKGETEKVNPKDLVQRDHLSKEEQASAKESLEPPPKVAKEKHSTYNNHT